MNERHREVYYVDFQEDFGLSGLAGAVCSGTGPRPDPRSVRAWAARAATEHEDYRIGADVRLLLSSPLPDESLRALWTALTAGRFDPSAGHGIAPRDWLRLLAEVCPADPPVRTVTERQVLDERRPSVPEVELRAAVRAELPPATAAPVPPSVAPALRRIVDDVDADLGFRLLLRVLKAYAVPVEKEQYDRLRGIGDRLAHPGSAVFEGLQVRWPPLDAGLRNFSDRFGLPFLAAMFHGEYDAWRWAGTGTPRDHITTLTHADPGLAPGTHAAVLLQDTRRLLDSPLSDTAVTTLWQTASARRRHADDADIVRWRTITAGPRRLDDFDLDGREWLREVAEVCGERLAEVAPDHTPTVSPPRTGLTDQVLRELAEIGPLLDHEAGAVTDVLRATVTSVDPDLGFRFLLQTLAAHHIPVTRAQFARHRDIGGRLGCHQEYVTGRLERLVRAG